MALPPSVNATQELPMLDYGNSDRNDESTQTLCESEQPFLETTNTGGNNSGRSSFLGSPTEENSPTRYKDFKLDNDYQEYSSGTITPQVASRKRRLEECKGNYNNSTTGTTLSIVRTPQASTHTKSLTLATTFALNKNCASGEASTVIATAQEALQSITPPEPHSTHSEAAPKPVIKKLIVRENQLLFVVGFGSPIWVNYVQARKSPYIQTFFNSLTKSDWERFIQERTTQKKEADSLTLGEDEVSVRKVLEMKLWNDEWMFRVKTSSLEVDLDLIDEMGLLENAIEFCMRQTGWRDLAVYT